MISIKKTCILILTGILLAVPLLTVHCLALPKTIVAGNDAHGNLNTLSTDTLSTWTKLQPLSSTKLTSLLGNTNDPIESAWLRLALISKKQFADQTNFVSELLDWRDQNPSHAGNQLFPDSDELAELPTTEAPQRIAVLLPESGPYANAAKAIHNGIMNAYQANQTSEKKQRIAFYNTAGSRNITAAYRLALAEGADFIIGPLTKSDVQTLSSQAPFDIPILALNYAAIKTSDPYFYQFGLLPEDDAVQIAMRAHQANLSHALVIVSHDAWGKRMNAAFTAEWKRLGGSIQENWYFRPSTDFNEGLAGLLGVNLETDKKLSRIKNNRDAMMKQRRQDFDVIILFAQSAQANIIIPLLKFYYAGNTPVYATSTVYASKNSVLSNHDLNSVIVCDIPMNMRTAKTATLSNKEKLYAIGQDAYRLSQSIDRLTMLPHFPIYSASGALVLDNKHEVHRRLPCFSINNTDKSTSQYAANT